MSGQYDRFFNSKGKGYTLLATLHDPYYDLPIHVYYIGEDNWVGAVLQGVHAWVCPVGNSLFSLLGKDELAALVAKAKAGEAIEVKPPIIPRKIFSQRVVKDDPTTWDLETAFKDTETSEQRPKMPASRKLMPRETTPARQAELPLEPVVKTLKRRELTHG